MEIKKPSWISQLPISPCNDFYLPEYVESGIDSKNTISRMIGDRVSCEPHTRTDADGHQDPNHHGDVLSDDKPVGMKREDNSCEKMIPVKTGMYSDERPEEGGC